jgi:hypothetical protein
MNEYIDYIFQTIGILFCLTVINKISWAYRLICFQLIISLITDFVAEWSGKKFGTNYLIYNMYIPIEVILLSLAGVLSIYQINWKKRFEKLIYLYIFISIVLIYLNPIHEFNTLLLIVGFLFLGVLNLYLIIDPNGNKAPGKNPMMIISIAHILYFCAVTPLFISRTYMLDRYPEMTNELYQIVNRSLMLIRYFLIAIAMIIVFINARSRKAVVL